MSVKFNFCRFVLFVIPTNVGEVTASQSAEKEMPKRFLSWVSVFIEFVE